MTEVINAIPARLKNMAVDGHVAGADDIIDDSLGLTQDQINAIVLGDAVDVSLTASKDASSTDENIVIKLVAKCSTNARITIKRGSDTIATGNNITTLNATALFSPSTTTMLDTFVAEFKVGELVKTVTTSIGAIFAVCGEDWTDAQGVSPDVEDTYIRTSAAGTYVVDVDKYVSVAKPGPFHVYFIVPRSMSISSATMSGFEFPLASAVNSTFWGADCKYYESSNDYPEGTLTIKIS